MYKYVLVSYGDEITEISFKVYDSYHEAYFCMKASFDENAARIVSDFTKKIQNHGEFNFEEYKNLASFKTGFTSMYIDDIGDDKQFKYEIIEVLLPDDYMEEYKSPMYMLLCSDNINWSTDTWVCESHDDAYTLMRMYFDEDMRGILREKYDQEKHHFSDDVCGIDIDESDSSIHIKLKEHGDVIHYEIKEFTVLN